ncbi:GDSL-type esterase/lipase family protein [Paenibacillus sp. KQZ6P-2]|uniref:GDSL-type esterase/lipase family protein n=1 Tax=Paenibacillus mangrovi TaxID=2931978 RepID=A0A9X1WK89_9BACL|nr:SGNH/GDSL hydrolase family protein [Paenibacillus mangrovi]MCJ8010538.1 GDSL-type esterase/lipase family protein [Paenibacillus mangrovi]
MAIPYTAVGDSLTVGFGAMPGNGFVPVYRSMAERKLGEFVSHENFGINGLTSSQLYANMKRSAHLRNSLKEAKIITISIGGNDLIRAAKSAPPQNITQHFNKALSQCQSNFSGIMQTINQLKSGRSSPYIVRAVGLYNPYPQVEAATLWVQQFNSYISGHWGAGYAAANIFSSFYGREKELLSLDHLHPNGRGYKVIADHLNRMGYYPLA